MSHLSPDQLETFKQRLLEVKSESQAILDQTVGDIKAPDLELPIGRLTRIDAIQMQGMAQMNRRQLEIRLLQVEASLKAFDSGTFGICRHCKEPVGLGRLEVLPESPFCLGCQESFEVDR